MKKITLKMALLLTLVMSFTFLGNFAKAESTFDSKMITDMETYHQLMDKKFNSETDVIEADWIRTDDERLKKHWRSKSDGFYYDFNSKYVFEENESLDDRPKDAMYHNQKNGYYYVSRKRYTNPYKYGYGVILIVEKWDTKPTDETDISHMVGYTYYELSDDRVFQNGKEIFDAGLKTQNVGYRKQGQQYPVVLTDIDYSLNEQNEDIITAVGLGFKEDQANKDKTINYRSDGSIRVGYTVISVYSMKVPEEQDYRKDYYNGYDVFVGLIDGVPTYDMPYDFGIASENDEDYQETMLHNYVKDQFLPRLNSTIHDKSVNWLLCQLSEDWLTNRVGHTWGKKPFMQLMQVDTSYSNEPQFVSGYYQTFEYFNSKVNTIQNHYFNLAAKKYTVAEDAKFHRYGELLEQTDGLSPFIVDTAFSHNRVNVLYLYEREHNTGWGNKTRFKEQEVDPNTGVKTIRPIANNGIELKVNSNFMKYNRYFLGGTHDLFLSIRDEGYSQFYRYIVNRHPTMAYIGAYNEYYDIDVGHKGLRYPNNMEHFNSFVDDFEDELDTRNLN